MTRLVRSPLQQALSTPLRVRPMSQFEAAAKGVQTQSSRAARAITSGVKGRPNSGEVNAPAYEVSNTFNFQSYFDYTNYAAGILPQPANQPIVPSTKSAPVMTAGYGLALAPSSQCPVAVQFFTGGMQGRSATYRMKPGEVIYPYGRPGDENGQFDGFQWGLPFGWLGGGTATLMVLRTADARVLWPSDHNEIIYHRLAIPIVAPAALPVTLAAYSGRLNWPQRFPWPNAISGSLGLNQRGKAAMGVFPTRTALSLRIETVAGSTMRMYFIGTNDFGMTANGQAQLTDVRAIDITWGAWAAQVGAVAPFNTPFQTQMLTGEAERFAADAGAVALASTAVELQGVNVDVVRYGRL